MAKFQQEVPKELLDQLDELSKGQMFEEMVEAAGKHVYDTVMSNIKKSFKSSRSLEKGLKVTKSYHTQKGSVNVYVGFYGYADSDKPVTVHTTKKKSGKTYSYQRSGVPIPLIAMAREYGTSHGEKKKPFFRKSFKKKELEAVMLQIQDKYIKGDDQ